MIKGDKSKLEQDMSTLQTKLTELQGEVAKQKTRENELLTQMEDIKHAKVRYLLNKDDQIEILLIDSSIKGVLRGTLSGRKSF